MYEPLHPESTEYEWDYLRAGGIDERGEEEATVVLVCMRSESLRAGLTESVYKGALVVGPASA